MELSVLLGGGTFKRLVDQLHKALIGAEREGEIKRAIKRGEGKGGRGGVATKLRQFTFFPATPAGGGLRGSTQAGSSHVRGSRKRTSSQNLPELLRGAK